MRARRIPHDAPTEAEARYVTHVVLCDESVWTSAAREKKPDAAEP